MMNRLMFLWENSRIAWHALWCRERKTDRKRASFVMSKNWIQPSSLKSILYICCVAVNTPSHTYLLTPWSRVLLEKLTGSTASQEIPHIFGTRKFITVLTSARHLSLSWANSIQSSQPPPISWRSILILSSHLRLGLLSGETQPVLS